MERELIVKYINNMPNNKPIYVIEIKKYIYNELNITNENEIQKMSKNINVILNRLKNDKVIRNAGKGIYYKPVMTAFGESTLNLSILRNYKYIQDLNNNIKGYITGAKIYNYLGFTTQVPNKIDIVTNECKYKKFYDKKYNAFINKPKILITNENCNYLQLLDILENKDNINIEVDKETAEEIIYKLIDDYELKFEKLIYYANITKNRKALERLINLARERV